MRLRRQKRKPYVTPWVPNATVVETGQRIRIIGQPFAIGSSMNRPIFYFAAECADRVARPFRADKVQIDGAPA